MTRGGPRVLSERAVWWMLNLFPPHLLGRIRIREVGRDCRSAKVTVRRSLLNRNLNGTTFGGTIFSAADGIHAVLLWQALARRGNDVEAWLRRASVEYRKPAATDLRLEFELTEADLDDAVDALAREGRFRRTFEIEARDADGEVCAVLRPEVYLRLPRGAHGLAGV
jgi:acyl-coenzyme A thioesterase PaaI-like protein